MDPPVTPAIALILIAAAVTLGYGVACWIWPFTACSRCSGVGKRRSPTGRAFRYCRRCKGTGARLRTGRWIYNQLTHIRKEGTR